MSELKPCPICGSRAVPVSNLYVKGPVRCGSWHCILGRNFSADQDDWNTRHRDAAWLAGQLERDFSSIVGHSELGEHACTIGMKFVLKRARELLE